MSLKLQKMLWLTFLVALCEVWINSITVRMLKYRFFFLWRVGFLRNLHPLWGQALTEVFGRHSRLVCKQLKFLRVF